MTRLDTLEEACLTANLINDIFADVGGNRGVETAERTRSGLSRRERVTHE
jgi:hypothetical protein